MTIKNELPIFNVSSSKIQLKTIIRLHFTIKNVPIKIREEG